MEQAAPKVDQKISTANVVLVDIEGTTSSISFVKDTLFPYVLANVESFLTEKFDSEDIKEAVKAVREQAKKDEEEKVEGFIAIPGEDASKEDVIKAIVDSVKWQMAKDRKVASLKTLQGLIWKKAYESKEIKGHVYADVAPALESWIESGRRVFIYSSGSVAAQKLLFGNSESGDLLKFFSGYFDTAVGAKQETESYKNIVKEIKCEAEEIVFLTDIVKEAKAAVDAGLNAVLVQREGNAELLEDDTKIYSVIKSFADLPVSTSGKRKPQDSGDEVPPSKVAKIDEGSDAKAVTDVKVIADSTEDKMEVPVNVIEPESKTEEKMECDSVDPIEKSTIASAEEKSEGKSEKTETAVANTDNDSEKMEVDGAPEIEIEKKTEEISIETEKKIEKVNEKEVTSDKTVAPEKKNTEAEDKVETENKQIEIDDKNVLTEELKDKKIDEVKQLEKNETKIGGGDVVDRVEKTENAEVIVSSSVDLKQDGPVAEVKKVVTKEMEIESEVSNSETKVESKEITEAVVKDTESPVTIDTTAAVEPIVVAKEQVESTESSSKNNKDEIVVDSTTEKVAAEKMDEDADKKDAAVSSATEEVKTDVVDEKMEESEIKSTSAATPIVETVTESKTEISNNIVKENVVEKMNTDESSKNETESTTKNKDSSPSTSTTETDTKENVKETPETTEEKRESEETKTIDDKVLKEQNSVSDSETKVAEPVESKEIGESSNETKADKQESVENGASSTVNGSEGNSEKIEEAKTNGADSDKENDNEKPNETTNGSSNTTNGVSEESEVKVKKVVTETTTPVVEATES